MRSCCESEASRHVKRHRDVAVCDGCGRLVLGYGNEDDVKKTADELRRAGVAFETGKAGKLHLVAKDRTAAPPEDEDEGAGEADDEEDDEDEGEADDEGEAEVADEDDAD